MASAYRGWHKISNTSCFTIYQCFVATVVQRPCHCDNLMANVISTSGHCVHISLVYKLTGADVQLSTLSDLLTMVTVSVRSGGAWAWHWIVFTLVWLLFTFHHRTFTEGKSRALMGNWPRPRALVKSMTLTLNTPGSVSQWVDSNGPLWPIRGQVITAGGLAQCGSEWGIIRSAPQ